MLYVSFSTGVPCNSSVTLFATANYTDLIEDIEIKVNKVMERSHRNRNLICFNNYLLAPYLKHTKILKSCYRRLDTCARPISQTCDFREPLCRFLVKST
ncbi:MAG: hypothetical protein ACTS73_08830 [Arsenophonus sp. NEOnobi-MAG3]